MAAIHLFVLFVFIHLVLICSAKVKIYQPRCPEFPCGNLGKVQFPFYNMTNPDCGLYKVDCTEPTPKIQFREGGHWFETEFISQLQDSVSINDSELDRSLDLCMMQKVYTYTRGQTDFSNMLQSNRPMPQPT